MKWRIPRLLTLLFALAAALPAQRVHIYLTDGGELIATEYEVKGGRVRYYSPERRQWEEIPTELVDLERTNQQVERAEVLKEEREAEDARLRAAERKARTELHDVPIDDGVYYRGPEKVELIAQAEVTVRVSKKRNIFAKLAPIPLIAGKRIQTIAGDTSPLRITEAKPIFYLRLETFSRFGIARLDTEDRKGERVAQVIATIPQSEEIFEQQDDVEVFRQQMAPSVYRVWPVEPLQPGEYAIIDYSPGKENLRVWDFAISLPAGTRP